MAAKRISTETLLTDVQKDEILNIKDQAGIIRMCKRIPQEDNIREAHRKYFCKEAYDVAVRSFGVLPQDYQEAVLDKILRKYSLTDLYFRYKEDFFLKCLVRLFSKPRFERKRFINEMFLFMSDESTVSLICAAEKLTTDSKVLKRMKKVKDSYYLQPDPYEEE